LFFVGREMLPKCRNHKAPTFLLQWLFYLLGFKQNEQNNKEFFKL